jgi:hypothetical protein
MAKDYGFEPRGLPGWRVFLQSDRFGTRWVFSTPADFPQSFSWDEQRQDHTTPIFRDWLGPFSGPECTTAKAAVAAAHHHFEAITKYMEEKGVTADAAQVSA